MQVWKFPLLRCSVLGVSMNSEILLRDYRPSDLEAIFRLDEACFPPEFRFDKESMRTFAEARDAITVVAEGGGGVVGFVIVEIERGIAGLCGYVVTLDVADESRRAGLAGKLMDQVERRAADVDASCIELHVFTGNEGAIRFYEGRGYVRVGVRRRFYGSVGLDAFVYRKIQLLAK